MEQYLTFHDVLKQAVEVVVNQDVKNRPLTLQIFLADARNNA